jgi:hypothetical protein
LKQELFDQLKAKYPKTYHKLTHIEASDGWYTLIQILSATIENAINDYPIDLQDAVYATQIKSKFGTLRFYTSTSNDFIDGAIQVAEGMSAHICEYCGNVGKYRNFRWIFTLCDDCAAKTEARRKQIITT